jgi:hypothetical protein
MTLQDYIETPGFYYTCGSDESQEILIVVDDCKNAVILSKDCSCQKVVAPNEWEVSPVDMATFLFERDGTPIRIEVLKLPWSNFHNVPALGMSYEFF